MIRIIAATRNPGKIKEIKEILYPADIISLSDIEFNEEIPETGSTFYENALLKASWIRNLYKNIYPDAFILADDSGLEIDALGGRPGVLSARYSGGVSGILLEMSGIPVKKRKARFVCCMVLISPSGFIYSYEGYCTGRISNSIRGTNGFGYDPIFLIKSLGYRKTMAEIPENLKNSISHRRNAINGLKKIIFKQELK